MEFRLCLIHFNPLFSDEFVEELVMFTLLLESWNYTSKREWKKNLVKELTEGVNSIGTIFFDQQCDIKGEVP